MVALEGEQYAAVMGTRDGAEVLVASEPLFHLLSKHSVAVDGGFSKKCGAEKNTEAEEKACLVVRAGISSMGDLGSIPGFIPCFATDSLGKSLCFSGPQLPRL